MHILCILVSLTLLLSNTRAECPHKRAGLEKWSVDATWGTSGKPKEGENVEITKDILVDESPPSLYNITIKPSGSLIFTPEVVVELKAANIFVNGKMEIGSDDCPYDNTLTITLTGTRQDHIDEVNKKVILVDAGGTLEIHGEPRRSWTKINQTLVPPTKSNDVYYNHETTSPYNADDGTGLMAYTFQVSGSQVTVKKFGLYNLKTQSQLLADQINNVSSGEFLVMAGQRKIVRKDGDAQDAAAYEALETLLYGNVTGTATLRSVDPNGDTWAFVCKKGTPSVYKEESNAVGTTSKAQFIDSNDLVVTVEENGDEALYKQTVKIWISNLNAINQKIDTIDDVTTWRSGDKVVITSTDFAWQQAEEREVVFCADCNNFQIRINKPVEYTHYGKVLHDAIDMRAEIALLSRKVVIRGEMEDTCPAANGNCGKAETLGKDTFGGHIKVLKDYKDVHIKNIELYNMGQQTDLGSYPMHWHLCLGTGDSKSYIKGCSIHHTFARCVTIHTSHEIEVTDNACFDHMGHGYFLEDGGEVNNTFDGNLAITTRKGTGDLEISDSERPAGFWITNPLTYFRNNIAAGGEGFGIWFIYPLEPLPPSRQFNIMAQFEARKTNILEITNSVAHSNDFNGIHVGGRIEEDRKTHCCNIWQPRGDPKDNDSLPINVTFSRLTGYKNAKFNMWLEGSLLNVTHISVADSSNGIMVSNEKLLEHAGRLSYSVIIGESENLGEPTEGYNRSVVDVDVPHSGVSIWRGPNQYFKIWFDGFKPNGVYDNAAIAKKRRERYFFSVTNSFREILFAFDDAENVGTYAISGNKSNKGWEDNRDGELAAGFTWYRKTSTGTERWYVVKPDPLSSAGSDCKLRPHWRMAMCKVKYGNLRVHHGGISAFWNRGVLGVFVRDKYPGAQLTFDLEKSAGPQVVLDGTESYTFHFINGTVPSWIKFTADGIETNETLRIGVCVPPGSTWTLMSKFPTLIKTTSDFIQVDSLAELDKNEPTRDGKKYYYDNSTSMVYYKFLGVNDRPIDELHECAGAGCPEIRFYFSGDISGSGDCRPSLYGSDKSLPAALPTITETFEANGDSTPPSDYGARATLPFASRSQVNGKYSDWAEWSSCTVTCGGGGIQYKTRECNDPMPEHGGGGCTNPHIKSRTCGYGSCG